MERKDNTKMMKLTSSEEKIMNFFWDKGPLFVREILELYNPPKPHFNTISTFVRGLEEKGFLSHKAFGYTFQYYAVISRDDFKQISLKGLIGKYFNNSVFSAVSSLVEQEEISLDELKSLISQVENGNKK